MIKICIIEDEPDIRRLLRKIIEKQEGFEVVSESGDFTTALTDFARFKPDVAFVDIDLNGQSGLECAKILTELNPKLKVIFATAHSEYMANAFEIYAFDYLVKPFNVERVVKTLSRIKGETATVISSEVNETVAQSDRYRDKLLIKGKEQVTLVDKKDIIYMERVESTTNIVTKEQVYVTSVSLGSLEDKLDPTEFMRCHKSYIINVSKIRQIEPYGRWTFVVKFKGTDGTALMTAKSYEEIRKLFE